MLKTVNAQKRVACLKDETDSAEWSFMTDSIYDSSRLPSSLEDKNLLLNVSETSARLFERSSFWLIQRNISS
jgi:hypothetical protein